MVPEKYSMTMPRIVFSGKDSLDNLKSVIGEASRVAVFTDQGVLSAGLVDLPLRLIREAGKEAVLLSDIPTEPSYLEVQSLVERFKSSGADFIVAIGGGSSMDTAKLASLLASSSCSLQDLLDNPAQAEKTVKSCFIPTTAGTGSEATPNAIVAVPEKELKIGIVNSSMVPDYVILDARMIRSLPRKIAAASGVDAMAHAIECYTSNKANPFSDTFALDAFVRIIRNIETACNDPDAMEAKNQMLIAAFYAGVAITCSGTTAVHALSYPLGGKYHIAHGVSNAMLLMPVMRFNEPAIRTRLARAYDAVAPEGSSCSSEEEKSAWIIERMEQIVKNLDIPTSLAEFNVPAEDLEGLVAAGMQVTRLLSNNMRPVTADDARRIYQQVLPG